MMRRPGRFFGQAFLAAACFALALGFSLFGRDDDPREITIVQPDGTQETYILIGVGTTSYEGYNFPKDILLSQPSYNENVAPGQVIILSVKDADIGDEHEFGLVTGTGGEDNAAFTLVGNELRSNATYDFEVKNQYNVRISASDISGLSIVKNFVITINDDRTEDFDNDGLTEAQEEDVHNTSDLDDDSDDDGLVDGPEVTIHNTDPTKADTESDGMPDGWEHVNGLNPLANDAAGDADGDQLNNLVEYQQQTDPQDADTDQDGFTDYAELAAGKSPIDRLSLPLPAPNVPQRMNYAGIVKVGTTPFTGQGKFKFAFVEANGSTLWSNDGTSSNGSEPQGHVTIAVDDGRYVLALGDVSLTNMLALPASVFTRNDVRLRVWFDDGVNGSQLLSPDQRVSSVSYSMVAGWATNALTARELARPPEVLGIAPGNLTHAPHVRSLYHVRAPTGTAIALALRALGTVDTFTVEGLPSSLTFNVVSGMVEGALPSSVGSHEVTLKATNVYGTSSPFLLLLEAE
ncbi:MAG: hypothetical protein CMI31_13975 [Opitutae bacterium]|nr:hypothetical protein [Opitutae bacterium]